MLTCPLCHFWVFIGGRLCSEQRVVTCRRCGTKFDVLAECGRKGGRERKPYTEEERQRRRERLAEARKRRWV